MGGGADSNSEALQLRNTSARLIAVHSTIYMRARAPRYERTHVVFIDVLGESSHGPTFAMLVLNPPNHNSNTHTYKHRNAHHTFIIAHLCLIALPPHQRLNVHTFSTAPSD
jgi:hypothetical protein